MKTLAVLSALVAVAIAAPALEENVDFKSLTLNDFTVKQQREKKSTLLEIGAEKTLDHNEDHSSSKTSSKSGLSSSVARTFSGFKKPIIVKKKIGYHVYRDSEEEQAQADSRESCKKQIKVKLCDDNNSVDKMKSASVDHIHDEMSESEMKHTINMAKEAVETFQRDLEKMEHNSGENIAERHNTLVHDKELHKDIEKARQALDHIKKRFKNFDATKTTNDETTPGEQLKMTEDDEKRRAQWKETVNAHKNVEIARNMEDNFKLTDGNELPVASHDLRTSNLNDFGKNTKSFATVEDIDATSSSTMRENTNVLVEDKQTRMDIHSDSLKKEKSANEDITQKEIPLTTDSKDVRNRNEVTEENVENISTQVKHSESKHSEECNADEKTKKENHKSFGDTDTKSMQLERHSSDIQENHAWDILDNKDMLKSSSDKSAHDDGDHTKLISDIDSNNGHLHSIIKNDQELHESKHSDTLLRANIKTSMRSDETDFHSADKETINTHKVDNTEQKSTLIEKSSMDLKSGNNNDNVHHDANTRGILQEMHLQHPALKQAAQFNADENLNHEIGLHKSLKSNMDPSRSASSISTSLDDKKEEFHVDEHKENDKLNDLAIPAHLRATADFHKTLLNNMEFDEVSHQSAFSKPSQVQNGHLMKKEQSELLERHVPQVQPNSEHLQSMMQFSDNPQHKTNQKAELKMATMFNNDQPNFNVQFNSPETFIEQTNEKGFIPFKSASDFQDLHLNDKVDTLSDPLKIRWAHEKNINLDKLKAAHFHDENMKMEGSSQHLNVANSLPFRARIMDNQHLGHNDPFNHQRWAQEKGEHNHMMMHGKSNIDNAMHTNSFMHMRGAPKMNLDFTNPNQWNPNQGAFRSSYGPSMPSSYGSGGGSGSSSGGSAVGVFPNANVGNCAVPILLSCSPSVVSGSLAKTNSYSAPSYRSEDLNFLKKRNIDIDDRNLSGKIHRHTFSHQPSVVLETKNQ